MDEANPKDKIGRTKLPVHLWPNIATAYGSVGMLEGATKYGRNNFVAAPVYASIYVAAAMRHLMAWMEGEEFTVEGGPHLGNALATIAIILKARNQGTLIDDREYEVSTGAYSAEIEGLVNRANEMIAKLEAQRLASGADAPTHWDRRKIRSASNVAGGVLGGIGQQQPKITRQSDFQNEIIAQQNPAQQQRPIQSQQFDSRKRSPNWNNDL